ncbi:CotY/CotZ family spore coat protein [Sporosarcina limicola]|uniref:Spore coat protein Z n=1 Tax=Sporosarcina limicola TaxID=34101 RepID=A0A927MQ49_9BACL|nr:CotY/CotZ family spore coat protein [Sporosarcina limicola]MBE1556932.1 spore coat protein Z [Sporosarcina limicola]
MGCGRPEEVGGNRGNDNCICEVVRAIRRIQDVRQDFDCDDCRTDCFTAPLGSIVNPSRARANTRVFMLLTDDGNPFKAMFRRERRHREHDREREVTAVQSHDKDCNSCFSVFFRVQNVFDNCCATLQVLEPRNARGRRVDIIKNGKIDFDALCEVERFEATGSCITVDLKCFCGIQCIKDVFIDCDDF